MWHDIFLKCYTEFTSEAIWTWCFLFWKVIIIYLKKYLNYCFKFFIRYKLYFQGIGPFHLDDQIYGHRISHTILLLSF